MTVLTIVQKFHRDMIVRLSLLRKTILIPEYFAFMCVCVFVWIYFPLYCKVPKFSDAKTLRCNLPKIQTKRPNLSVSRHKDANGISKL